MSGGLVRRGGGTLARRAVADRAGTKDFLAFDLGEDRFALPLGAIREILKVPIITEVPRARGSVLGIISVRGVITTVLDLRRRLRRPSVPAEKASRILLVDGGSEIIGLLVDQVEGVYRLQEDEIEDAGTVSGDLADYVNGIGRPGRADAEADDEVSDDILVLLDPEPLLRQGAAR